MLALLIAFPLAWYLMHLWLQGFVDRVNVGMGTFTSIGGLALLIAVLTVSYTTIRAALANPIRAIRSE
jgi:putative ABC transport system permease protein